MNISGIRASAGFYDYNDIKNSELRSQQIQQAKEEEQQEKQTTNPEQDFTVRDQQNYTSYDYAKQYEPNTSYEMKGADKELGLLDVDQVLSDVEKDFVLQQYQFFVGENMMQLQNSNDVINDMGEKFVL